MGNSKRSGQYVMQPTGYKAFIPQALPPSPPINMTEETTQLLNTANEVLARLDSVGYLLPTIDHLLAMYVRKEALLSSQIEGTQASLEDIFAYENKEVVKNPHDVQEVVNYIKALNHGLKRLEEFPMSIRLLKEIHTLLLQNTRGNEKTPGEFRRSQNWIGPQGCSLNNASFIPPPPDEAYQHMGELELFLHKETKIAPLIICALIHYQFETIHPFLDGNGRLGRLLITFYLCWKKIMNKPLLYMSYYFKLYRQEYYDRLNLVRLNGDYEQWIAFFLRAAIWTAESSIKTIKNIVDLTEKHKKLILESTLTSSIALQLIERLLQNPYISIQALAKEYNISFPTAQKIIDVFVEKGLLKELTGKKRGRCFCYWEYMNLLDEGAQP